MFLVINSTNSWRYLLEAFGRFRSLYAAYKSKRSTFARHLITSAAKMALCPKCQTPVYFGKFFDAATMNYNEREFLYFQRNAFFRLAKIGIDRVYDVATAIKR